MEEGALEVYGWYAEATMAIATSVQAGAVEAALKALDWYVANTAQCVGEEVFDVIGVCIAGTGVDKDVADMVLEELASLGILDIKKTEIVISASEKSSLPLEQCRSRVAEMHRQRAEEAERWAARYLEERERSWQ